MPLLPSLVGLIAGYKGDKKANKLAKEQYTRQQGLTDKQTSIADYISQLAQQTANTSSDIYDPSGGFTRYNPATGKYEYALGDARLGIQNASYGEELLRNTTDQQIRRQGLTDAERMRQVSSGRATRALSDIDAARRGVGMVDPNAVAGEMLTDRTRQVNAGYDDAERAAKTLQLRTGSSAVGDALTALARDRVRTQASVGNPNLEGIQAAQELNAPRTQQLYGAYKQFGDEGRNWYDAQFAPSTYEDTGRANLQKGMEFDMNKLDLAMGGNQQAATTIANAARGETGAYDAFTKSRVKSPLANLATGYSNMIENAAKQYATMGMG
jgi:hypothetical protein